MSSFKIPPPVCHLIRFSSGDVARALNLETAQSHQSSARRICRTVTKCCTLDVPAAHHLVQSVDDALLRHRGALLANNEGSIVRSLDRLFWLFHDSLEARVAMDAGCSCSWELRLADADALTDFLEATARAYWSTGAKVDGIVRLVGSLARNFTYIAERKGICMGFAPVDASIEARADRHALRLFEMADDLGCDNWGCDTGS